MLLTVTDSRSIEAVEPEWLGLYLAKTAQDEYSEAVTDWLASGAQFPLAIRNGEWDTDVWEVL